MSRYVEAKWLLGVAELSKGVIDVDDVYNAPNIDIVWCAECKKRKKNKFCLEHMRYEKDDSGHCHYGERGDE